VSNRLSDAIYMTKRVVARHPNVDLAAPYPRKLAFDGGEHMVIVKLGVQTGRHVALDRPYIMLKPTLQMSQVANIPLDRPTDGGGMTRRVCVTRG